MLLVIRNSFLLVFALLVLSLSSCINYKKSLYFYDSLEEMPQSGLSVKKAEPSNLIVNVDDILSVTVQTLDVSLNNNISETAIGSSENNSEGTTGYMVDKKGDIDLPMIGKINVAGKTTLEIKELIYEKAKSLYKNPVVNVRLSNFTVTVLGEVGSPSQYVFYNEKTSVLDAIAKAGDLTIYGKRDNILLIRDENGEKKITQLNINSSDIFNSPYFYLKQNDVIYVVPKKGRVASSETFFARNLSILASFASLLVVGLSTYTIINNSNK